MRSRIYVAVMNHRCDNNARRRGGLAAGAGRAAAAVTAPSDTCDLGEGRFLVSVGGIVFDNPGDAGPDFEPYGDVDLILPFGQWATVRRPIGLAAHLCTAGCQAIS